MFFSRLQDWKPLIEMGALHRAKVDFASRTLSDWNAEHWSRGLTQLSYLIVDDNRQESSLLREAMLTYSLRRLTEVSSATEGLYELSKRHYDVALVNMSMRDLGGVQFAAGVRRGKRVLNPEIPIIALLPNGCGADAGHDEDLKAGIDGFLEKPLCPMSLFEHIRRSALLFGINSLSEHDLSF